MSTTYSSHWRKRRVAENRSWVASYKLTVGCSSCSERDVACLDLHHRPNTIKVAEVSAMVLNAAPLVAIIAEVVKCDVLCANCHRKLHHRRRHDDSPPSVTPLSPTELEHVTYLRRLAGVV